MSAPLTHVDRRGDEMPIGRVAWIDAAGNGLADGTGFPLANVEVSLRDAFGSEVARTLTDANGNYGFDNLPMGHYTVVFTAPRSGAAAPHPGARLQLDDLDQMFVPVSLDQHRQLTAVQTWTVSQTGWQDRTSVLRLSGNLG